MKKLLLTGAALMALFSATAQEQIITSFEESEELGYTIGTDIAEYDALWSTFNTVTQEAAVPGAIVVGDTFPTEGTQSLYFPAAMVGTDTEDGDRSYAVNGVLDFRTLTAPFSLGFDVTTNEINTQSGSNFFVEFYSYNATAQTSENIGLIVFNYTGDVRLGNLETLQYVPGGTFSAETAKNIKYQINDDSTISILSGTQVLLTYAVDEANLTGLYYFAFGVDDWGTDYSLDRLSVNLGDAAGVKNNIASQFTVSPNPTSNVVNVASVNALVNNVSIADLNGRTVKSAKFDGIANAQVNISDLASGVYMMTIASDKGISTKKIVKN